MLDNLLVQNWDCTFQELCLDTFKLNADKTDLPTQEISVWELSYQMSPKLSHLGCFEAAVNHCARRFKCPSTCTSNIPCRCGQIVLVNIAKILLEWLDHLNNGIHRIVRAHTHTIAVITIIIITVFQFSSQWLRSYSDFYVLSISYSCLEVTYLCGHSSGIGS